MKKYILIDELKERTDLEKLSKEELIEVILELKEDMEDMRLENREEY